MLDANFIADNIELIKKNLAARNVDIELDNFLEIHQKRKKLRFEVEKLKNERKVVSDKIGVLKKSGKDASDEISRMKEVSAKIKVLDKDISDVRESEQEIILSIPNIYHESVPVAADETGNVTLRKWGTPRKFEFQPKNHWDIGSELGILDMSRAAKITGARFSLLIGAGALLERALIQFMLDTHTRADR